MSEGYKILVVAMLLTILASLGNALFHMSSGPEHAAQTLRALTVRISLSIALFLLLLGGWYFGLFSPLDVHP
jgi:hypothetical protein